MEIKIIEKNPSGRESIKAMLDFLRNTEKRSEDVSDVFRSIEPLIKEKLKYEFSEANPAGWDGLKPKYKAWKAKNGYPTTIGILTGTLKEAATRSAKVEVYPQKMIYDVNPNLTNSLTGKSTGDYMGHFNSRRTILPYAREYIQKIIKDAVRRHIKEERAF